MVGQSIAPSRRRSLGGERGQAGRAVLPGGACIHKPRSDERSGQLAAGVARNEPDTRSLALWREASAGREAARLSRRAPLSLRLRSSRYPGAPLGALVRSLTTRAQSTLASLANWHCMRAFGLERASDARALVAQAPPTGAIGKPEKAARRKARRAEAWTSGYARATTGMGKEGLGTLRAFVGL